MTIMGTRVQRKEDPTFLTVGARYTADLDEPRLDGALHATFVRSMVANGEVLSVDVADALEMPGVVAVVTAADLPEGMILPGMVPLFPEPMLNRPVLAATHVRFVGEPVAVVLTEEPSQGEEAADAVFVDIEPLPAVVTIDDAAPGEVVVHTEGGTHQCRELSAMGRATGLTDEIDTHHVFVFIGAAADTGWLGDVVERDQRGYVLTGPDVDGRVATPGGDRDRYLTETSMPGVFAVGDIRSGSIKRVVHENRSGKQMNRTRHLTRQLDLTLWLSPCP